MRYLVAVATLAAACTASNPSALPQPLACACEAVAGERGFPGINGRDGEPGAQGPKGDRGDPGAAAVAARVPHLVTDAGDDLGVFVGGTGAVRETPKGALYVIRHDIRFMLAYERPNCTGIGLVTESHYLSGGTESHAFIAGDGYIYRLTDGQWHGVVIESVRSPFGQCDTSPRGIMQVLDVDATGIIVSPFRSLRVELR